MASIVAFFAKPQMLIDSFRKMFRSSNEGEAVLQKIELPLSVSIVAS